VALASLVVPAALLSGQEHSHGGADRPLPPRADSSAPAPPLSRLLAASDDTVRAMERAVAEDAPRMIAESTRAYVAAAEALERYVEETAPERTVRDLPRVEKALGRQRDLLQGLAERQPSGPGEGIEAAMDANARAFDAVGAARDGVADAQGSHHGRQRRHGCGHP
jgi:hypothetical protein